MNTLAQDIIEELLKVKKDANLYHRESQTLEFKESYNFAGLAEYFRDFAAFAEVDEWGQLRVKEFFKKDLCNK